MSDSEKVRFSRDGDQFHYFWAARRCLSLLLPDSGLVKITIEGASKAETELGEEIDAGEELIDVAEYYGSENINEAKRICYFQLKHSTQDASIPWPPSGLRKTLCGFAKRYKDFEQRIGVSRLSNLVEFYFVTNRPINLEFIETIRLAAANKVAANIGIRYKKNYEKLEEFTSLTGTQLAEFCKLLHLQGMHGSYWNQRGNLSQEIKGYLPGDDADAPVQLKELVTRKALSENTSNPSITKIDVLRSLGTTEEKLFPAPCYVESADQSIPRSGERDLVSQIISANGPVIIHAAGGVGKSVLSQRINLHLPKNSVTIAYDCYGNGGYRRPESPRHRHKDALVQIANELSARGLCDPLIPSSNADKTDYLKAFSHRLRQGNNAIKSLDEQSILCIAIDAADNAEMAAKEFGEIHSFARDILRIELPDRLRLVVICRTERQELLDPPPNITRLELKPFNREETATFLRMKYPDASELNVDEFHRLTSFNPRVQVTALAQAGALNAILRSLGPTPTTVDSTISKLLLKSISNLRENLGSAEQSKIDSICYGLAILRPLIPIEVLAFISEVSESAVKSFAADFGRPLLVIGDAIQFRDEPVETWFRENFMPSREILLEFIRKLKLLATKSGYVASALPRLMLEGGQLDELVELALSSSALPIDNPIGKRDIELQRLQFAFKASLRANKHREAVKLALKASSEMLGNARQQKLLQNNTDMAALLIDSGSIQEIISRRTFGANWIGSHHAYEAGLLSYLPEFSGEASSRLRMAGEWLRNWSFLSKEEKSKENIAQNDIAEMAMAIFNLHGSDACANELRSWKPREVSFYVGKIISQRLVDHSRYEDLDRLALSAGNNIYLILAILIKLKRVSREPPKSVVERAFLLVQRVKFKLREDNQSGSEIIKAITVLVEASYKYKIRNCNELVLLLTEYLVDPPAHSIVLDYGSAHTILIKAYVLRAALAGRSIEPLDLAHSKLRKEIEKTPNHSESQELRTFREVINAVLPWYKLQVKNLLNPMSVVDLSSEIASLQKATFSAMRNSFRHKMFIANESTQIWFNILVNMNEYSRELLDNFNVWHETLEEPITLTTLTNLAWLSARSDSFQSQSFIFATKAHNLISVERCHADSKADNYINLARAILKADLSEASQYFSLAVEVTSKIGDEIYDRWQAILDLGEQAIEPSHPNPEIAYKLSRCAEIVYEYDDNHFDWERSVRTIAGLDPSSCIAILSRWRDRDFGLAAELLPTAVQYLIEQQLVDPKILPPLICLRANWDYGVLLRKSLEASESRIDQETILTFFMHYMRLDDRPSSVWVEIKQIAETKMLNIPEIDQLILFSENQEALLHESKASQRTSAFGSNNNEQNSNSDNIFQDFELHTENGISSAYTNYKSLNRFPDDEYFFDELFSRVLTGKESELIRSVSEISRFHLWQYKSFLERIPATWKSRLSIKSAIASLVKKVYRRYCLKVTKRHYYELLPLKLASDVSGLSEEELIDDVLLSIGELSDLLDAKQLFSLISLLTSKLSKANALDTLSFGIEQFNDVLKISDGDGSWAASLEPPSDINGSIAGYIWRTLASPEASARWEATHVVRGLCIFNQITMISHLVEFAKRKSGGCFADPNLHFYSLHGQQWLMIALARSATESPEIVVPHVNFLLHFALDNEPHILIRHFASKAVLSLIESGKIKLDVVIVNRLKTINISPLPTAYLKPDDKFSENMYSETYESKPESFFFDYDMSRYWFGALGNCFGETVTRIESEAASVIHDDWQLIYTGHYKNDARINFGLFHDRESHHHQGSYPQTDDLNFYLSYHALMVVAGKLLKTAPLNKNSNNSQDKFNEWIDWHLLSRPDGSWLADRRDPQPLEWPSWKNLNHGDDWRWSVSKSDFDRLLGTSGDKLNLWGRWTSISGKREESAHISSALVSPDRSYALLRALQTVENPYSYRIPNAGDSMEIDKGSFKLKGWIEDNVNDSKLDMFDPWSADLKWPPLRPSQLICEQLHLESDTEFRSWQWPNEFGSRKILWSHVWGSYRRKNDDLAGEQGRRLQAAIDFVTRFLCILQMDLIVEVEIDRRIRRSRYENDTNDKLPYTPPNARIFIIKSDGTINSL
jgi:hypothetical protein